MLLCRHHATVRRERMQNREENLEVALLEELHDLGFPPALSYTVIIMSNETLAAMAGYK
jgi:hypothetical protein